MRACRIICTRTRSSSQANFAEDGGHQDNVAAAGVDNNGNGGLTLSAKLAAINSVREGLKHNLWALHLARPAEEDALRFFTQRLAQVQSPQ